MLLRIRSLNMREKIMNFLLIFSLALIAKTLADKSFDLECVSVPDRMFTRDPESCRGYILCAGNRIKAKGICPQPFMFNDTTQLCDYPQFVNCNSCKTNIGLQHFVDERNCSNFYKCVDNVRRHFRCADNMYFDYGSSSCLDKSFVFCKDDIDAGFDGEGPSNDPWAIPGNEGNRPPPPVWGPPRPPPGTGGGIVIPPGALPPPADIPIPQPTRPPGGIGVWRPTGTTAPPPARPPWGPPDAPIGGGF